MSRLTAAQNSPPTAGQRPETFKGHRGVGKPKHEWRIGERELIKEFHPGYNARLRAAQEARNRQHAEDTKGIK